MMRLLAFTLLTLSAMTVAWPIKRGEGELVELLKRLLEADKQSPVERADEEKRSASVVMPGLDTSLSVPGKITLSLLAITSSDNPALDSNTCYYDVTVINEKDIVVHKEQYEKGAMGSNSVVINELPVSAAGKEYAVQTCRVDSLDTMNVVDDRCTCHKCKLFDTQEALDNDNNLFMAGNYCDRVTKGYTVPSDVNGNSNCIFYKN